jgi:TMEM164 family
VVAAVACSCPGWLLGLELADVWGLAGTIQAVIPSDLNAGCPELDFFQFVVGQIGSIVAAFYLVVGLRILPRRGPVPRVFAITAAYADLVVAFDRLTPANCRYLASTRAGDLSLLGPWLGTHHLDGLAARTSPIHRSYVVGIRMEHRAQAATSLPHGAAVPGPRAGTGLRWSRP